jgi:hypothetical protein
LFAFTKIGSGGICDDRDMALIHAIFQEHDPAHDRWSAISTYEKWVEIVVTEERGLAVVEI